jgi:hypothetical protein
MTLSLNVQFNGSAINLLVSRDEASGDSTSRRTMSRCSFDLKEHRLKERGAYDPGPKNHGYHYMESIGTFLDGGTS